MNPRVERDPSPAELARLGAYRARLVRLQEEDSARYAEEMRVLHEASQLAGDIAVRGSSDSRASELAHRSISAEFGTALRVSDRTMQRRMATADVLVRDFPGTFRALGAARVFRGHVAVILEAGAHLPDAASRAEYEQVVLPFAEREAPARLRPYARFIAERLHPRSLEERHREAAACRGVWLTELPDGMAEMLAIIPSVAANGIMDRLNQFAEHHQRAEEAEGAARVVADGAIDGVAHGVADGSANGAFGLVSDRAARAGSGASPERRTKDQRRADAFIDLGLTGDPAAHSGPAGIGAIRARVALSMPVLSLIGRADAPAMLSGGAPVDAATARVLVAAAPGWDRVLTHPISGAVLAVDRYTPSAELKRTLRVRDQHCRFPGCRQPASASDLDHTIDFAHGGQTRENNLAHLCRRHHTLKHATTWSVVQKPGGVLEWTSPTGQMYPDAPTSTVIFRPETDWNDARARASTGGWGADTAPF